MEYIKGFMVKAKSHKFGKVTVKHTLEDYYKLLGCELIDIVTRKIGGKYYDIIIDDEGLFKDEPVVTGLQEDGSPLVGSLLVVGLPDSEGESTDLTDSDIEAISKSVKYAYNFDGFYQPVLVGLGY